MHGFVIDLTRGVWWVGRVTDCRCLAVCHYLVIMIVKYIKLEYKLTVVTRKKKKKKKSD